MSTVLPKIFALAPTNHRFAEKNWLSGSTGVSMILRMRVTMIMLYFGCVVHNIGIGH